ncbi:MAG: helix-hairpin-helix domain-containing protein [Acidobacteriota bacterium]
MRQLVTYECPRLNVPAIVTLAALLLGTFVAAMPASAAETPKQNAEVVNINEATADQIAQLPRVGPALAKRILEFRKANGKFKRADDLILVRGIGEKTFRMLEPFVVIQGKTTLARKLRTRDLPSRTSEEKAAGEGSTTTRGDVARGQRPAEKQ